MATLNHETALLACPFCGNKQATAADEIAKVTSCCVRATNCGGTWCVECGGCGARGPQYDECELAVTTWNRRIAS